MSSKKIESLKTAIAAKEEQLERLRDLLNKEEEIHANKERVRIKIAKEKHEDKMCVKEMIAKTSHQRKGHRAQGRRTA